MKQRKQTFDDWDRKARIAQRNVRNQKVRRAESYKYMVEEDEDQFDTSNTTSTGRSPSTVNQKEN